MDLGHAYKQWARHPVSSAFGVVVVWNPVAKVAEACVCRAMCFGEKAAVWQCNRAFRAFARLNHRLLCVVASDYVGDVPPVEPELTVDGAVAAADGLAELLGWELKPVAPGQERPAEVFDALGG